MARRLSKFAQVRADRVKAGMAKIRAYKDVGPRLNRETFRDIAVNVFGMTDEDARLHWNTPKPTRKVGDNSVSGGEAEPHKDVYRLALVGINYMEKKGKK